MSETAGVPAMLRAYWWQPIATAPVGPILLWDGSHVSVGERSTWRFVKQEFYGLICGETAYEGGGDYAPMWTVEATHWMPLPGPPAIEAALKPEACP